jgi:hypothetical protein
MVNCPPLLKHVVQGVLAVMPEQAPCYAMLCHAMLSYAMLCRAGARGREPRARHAPSVCA